VSIPAALIADLEDQLAHWAGPGLDGFVFPGTKDQPFRHGSLYTAWRRATKAVGVDELHFHDLRHTGATLAATAGATTRELMARMGHASPRAALIYQHATQERDQAIARPRATFRSVLSRVHRADARTGQRAPASRPLTRSPSTAASSASRARVAGGSGTTASATRGPSGA